MGGVALHGREAEAIQRVTESLIMAFAERLSAEEITATVIRVHGGFADARIREFVPVMVEGIARRELKAVAVGEPFADTAKAGFTA